MKSTQHKIAVGAATVAFRVRGDAGAPIVFIHGTGLSSRYWSPLAASLGASHRTVAIDLLGYGDSSAPASGDDFHLDEDRDAVISVLSTLSAPAHLVGHSYGGLVALRVALAQPERVRSLALYEPVAFSVLRSAGRTDGIRDLDQANEGGLITSDATGGSEVWLRRFVDYWNGAGAFDAMTAPAREALLKGGRKSYLEVRSNLADATSHEVYARITAPVLVVHGSRSPLAARATAEVLAEHLPRAKKLVLENAGHLGPFTHGDAFEAMVRGALAES
ncbi:MAG: alpha/beta hydrolase [Polyangiaceae bacterium]